MTNNNNNNNNTLSDLLRKFDTHTSISPEYQIKTTHGAILTLLTILTTLFLLRTEYNYNLTPQTIDTVHVNATTPTGLQLEFDVTFNDISCALLSIDSNDPTGQPQSLHLDRYHRVWKHRLDGKTGRMIGRKSRFEMGGTLGGEDGLEEVGVGRGMKKDDDGGVKEEEKQVEEEDEEECGSCYGAGEEGECCNTCDDVKRAYTVKGWNFPREKVKQCVHQVKSESEIGEGCNVHGIVALDTGGGNLHMTPGRGLEKMGEERDALTTLSDFIVQTFEQFNVSHTVNRLRFGQEFPGQVHQLDGKNVNVEDAYGMYQYYIQLVPTVYKYLDGRTVETFQYSVTEHMRHVSPGSGRGLPGVFFFYEVSALHVNIEEKTKGWIRFLTSVCCIVGGVYTVMTAVDAFVYDALRGGASLMDSSLG